MIHNLTHMNPDLVSPSSFKLELYMSYMLKGFNSIIVCYSAFAPRDVGFHLEAIGRVSSYCAFNFSALWEFAAKNYRLVLSN